MIEIENSGQLTTMLYYFREGNMGSVTKAITLSFSYEESDDFSDCLFNKKITTSFEGPDTRKCVSNDKSF